MIGFSGDNRSKRTILPEIIYPVKGKKISIQIGGIERKIICFQPAVSIQKVGIDRRRDNHATIKSESLFLFASDQISGFSSFAFRIELRVSFPQGLSRSSVQLPSAEARGSSMEQVSFLSETDQATQLIFRLSIQST